MLFEWHETKRRADLAKHLIDFADAGGFLKARYSRKCSGVTAKIECSPSACWKTLRSS
jgi:hypothetical protein